MAGQRRRPPHQSEADLCDDASTLEPQPSSLAVLRHKYAATGELTPADVNRRVARALAQAEASQTRSDWAQRFERALGAGFIPAGRILAGAGRMPARPLINCFVQPLGPADGDQEQGLPALATALEETACTLRLGGGVGLDFSALGPGQVVPALQAFECAAQACTAEPSASCEAEAQRCEALGMANPDHLSVPSAQHPPGGRTRRAQLPAAARHVRARPAALMGVLHVDHPDLGAFVEAKAAGGLTHFNLSVGLSDAFMQRLEANNPDASARWQHLVHAAWQRGEPGVLFLDRLQHDNSLAWRETLRATNPCGEQPLPAYGSCCLGSINLSRLVRHPFTASARLDEEGLAALARTAVRMLDNVIDLTTWPLAAQRTEALQTRRIGLGFTGLADALIMLGLRYDRTEGRKAAARIAQTLRHSAVQASVELAQERGPFPSFDARRHLAPPGFASRLPAALQAAIARHGLRNSHLLSVAPTGSISLAMADNVASGIEPVWAWQTVRPVHRRDGSVETLRFANHAWRTYRAGIRRAGRQTCSGERARGPAMPLDDGLPPAFVTAASVSPLRQVAMAEAVAPFIDAAISKTVLLRPGDTAAQVDRLLRYAWRHGLKGLTVYRPNPVIRPLFPTSVDPELARKSGMRQDLSTLARHRATHHEANHPSLPHPSPTKCSSSDSRVGLAQHRLDRIFRAGPEYSAGGALQSASGRCTQCTGCRLPSAAAAQLSTSAGRQAAGAVPVRGQGAAGGEHRQLLRFHQPI